MTIPTLSTQKKYICIYFYTTTTQRSLYIYVPLRTCHITFQQLSLTETFFSFYAYAATVFLSFLETNNISGYLVTPLSWRHYIITIYPTNPRLPFYVTHLNIYCTSLAHHLHACKLPSKTVSQQMTYLHPFDPT